MTRIHYNKLIRDFIPKKIVDAGDVCEVRTLKDDEFVPALLAKVIEEATELQSAHTRDEILAEYADVMVALDAFTRHYEFSEADIMEAIGKNIEKKGLFNERQFLLWSEHTNETEK